MEGLTVNESYYGSELLGRGHATDMDRLVGGTMFGMALFAVALGFFNIVIIKKVQIFHNAFGALWLLRTVGEIGSNVVHVVYSGPATYFQSASISPLFGIASFSVGYTGSLVACLTHQMLSVNRCVAVCFPFSYDSIFSKRNTVLIGLYVLLLSFGVLITYHAFPCQEIGYSPTLYEYVFVKCAHIDREYSLVGMYENYICWAICLTTVFFDGATLLKIIYIGKFQKHTTRDKKYRLDVRFFVQSAMQNLAMMAALSTIVVVNNSQATRSVISYVLAVDILIVSNITNGLVLVIFNPEVRQRLGLRFCAQRTSRVEMSDRSTVSMVAFRGIGIGQ